MGPAPPDPSELLHERELTSTQRLRAAKAGGKMPVMQMQFQTSRTNVTPEFGVDVQELATEMPPDKEAGEAKATCQKKVAFTDVPPEVRGGVNPCAIIIIILVIVLIGGVSVQYMNHKKYI